MSARAYFITWTTYGSWLRGDDRGSVIDENRHGRPVTTPNPRMAERDSHRLRNSSRLLSLEARVVVEEAIRGTCEIRGWRLHAVNVRSNHVHVVVSANAAPEKVMGDLKAWGTRRLREHGLASSEERIWTTHGSTRYLFDDSSLVKAVDYVVRHQDMKGSP